MAQRIGRPRGVFATLIEDARGKVPREDLHRIYWGLGGRIKLDAFNDYFRGETEPSVTDADLIVRAINTAHGKRVLKPLLDEAPVPPPEGGAVLRSVTDPESLRCFTQTEFDQEERAA